MQILKSFQILALAFSALTISITSHAEPDKGSVSVKEFCSSFKNKAGCLAMASNKNTEMDYPNIRDFIIERCEQSSGRAPCEDFVRYVEENMEQYPAAKADYHSLADRLQKICDDHSSGEACEMALAQQIRQRKERGEPKPSNEELKKSLEKGCKSGSTTFCEMLKQSH